MIFLEYSKKEFETEQRIKELEQKRKLQRARIVAIVLGSFLVVALLAMVYAFYQQTEAKRQEQLARVAEAKAVENAELAKKNEKIALDQKAEAERQKTIAEQQTILAKKSEAEALRQKGIAEEQTQLAKKNEAEAKRQTGIAETKEKEARAAELEAKRQEAEAKRQRLLATAKSMAVKSVDLYYNPEQEALFAQQAYNFNVQNGGYLSDNDIYRGLYSALKNQPEPHPLTKSLEGHQNGAVRALVTREVSNHIYSGGSDGKIIQWKYSNAGWNAHVIVDDRSNTAVPYQVYTMDVSPDGKWLLAGGILYSQASNNYVELYNLQNESAPPKKIYGFTQAVENIAFTPDGKGFYARDNAGRSIKYSDLNTAKEVALSKEKIMAIDLSSDGRKIAGVGDNGTLYVWDIANNYAVASYKMPGPRLTAVAFNPTGTQIVVGNELGRVWITTGGLVVRELTGHSSAIEQIKYNHKGTFMATASKDKTLRLWNVNKLDFAPTVLSESDWAWSVTFSPDDEQLMVGVHSVQEKVVNQVEQAIHAYPTKIEKMSDLLCAYTQRNMSKEEWDVNVGEDITYQKTCSNLPSNYK